MRENITRPHLNPNFRKKQPDGSTAMDLNCKPDSPAKLMEHDDGKKALINSQVSDVRG